MPTRRTELPGVGTKDTLALDEEGELVVVHHHAGVWELARVDREGNATPLLQLSAEQGAELGRVLTQGAPLEADLRREMLFRTIALEWLTLEEDSPLRGLTLAESAIRPRTGASVIAVIRGEQSIPNPPPSLRFERGDTLVVLGRREQVETFLEQFARPPTS
jgi:TrkA domain protein